MSAGEMAEARAPAPVAAGAASSIAAVPEELAPFDGWCSKGGIWVLSLLIPPLLLVAALVIGVYLLGGLTWQYVLGCIVGLLVLELVCVLLIIYVGEYDFQIWALQHPTNFFARHLVKGVGFTQGLMSCNNEYMHKRRLAYGPNFCCAGQVCLGEHAEVERALLSPQARTFYLGQTRFMKKRCPGTDLGQRTTFLLAISDEGAGGNGDHEKFKACMGRYFFGSSDVRTRQTDDFTKGLLDKLAQEYMDAREVNRQRGGPAEMNDASRGLLCSAVREYKHKHEGFFRYGGPLEIFTVRYLHYVLFGIDLKGEDMKIMMEWLTDNSGTVHYIWPAGVAANKANLINKVSAIYEAAPALQLFEEGVAAHARMTKAELARTMTAVIRIAGKTGSFQLLDAVLGGKPLPNYTGEATGSVDVTRHWDELDLDDRDELKRYIIEVARLYPAVNTIHRVAREPFGCRFKGRTVSFPAGTIVMVPIVYGGLDKEFWGPTAYEFDHRRANLMERFCGFNSVGDRHAGRICPGREVALDLCADVLAALGRARRAAAAHDGAVV